MAKITSLLLSLILIFNCSNNTKQNNVTFNTSLGGNDRDRGESVQQTSDGGYIITGFTKSYGEGFTDVVLLKTDFRGKQEWIKTFGGLDVDGGESVQLTSDGGFIVTGCFGSINHSLFLLKTDSFGNEEWFKTFKKDEYDCGYSVQQTTDGGYVIIGGDWLIKTNSIGDEEWSKTVGDDFRDLVSISETLDTGFILTGSGKSKNNDEGYDILLIKTDALGDEVWERAFGGSGFPRASSAHQTLDGGYIIFGSTDYNSIGGTNVWLIKTNREGIEEWNKTFKYGGRTFGRSGQQTSDGGFIVGGDIKIDGEKFNEMSSYLLKTNSLGEEEWVRVFRGPYISYVRQTHDGGYVFTGLSSSKDIWLAKTDSSGNILAK